MDNLDNGEKKVWKECDVLGQRVILHFVSKEAHAHKHTDMHKLILK